MIIDNYHNAQQDLLETFVDRGQLRKLAEPTKLASGKRIPGLKLDHPRQLAVMHALVRFANIAAASTFTTAEVYTPALDALGLQPSQYSLASFATISPNCVPEDWWQRSLTLGAIVSPARAIRSA